MLNISDNNDYIVFYVKFWFNRKSPFIFYDTLTKWTSSYRKHIQATILFYLKLLFFFVKQMEKENSNRKSNERRVGWIYVRITLYVIRMTLFYFSLIHFYMKRNIVAVKFYLQQKNAFILSINKKKSDDKILPHFSHFFRSESLLYACGRPTASFRLEQDECVGSRVRLSTVLNRIIAVADSANLTVDCLLSIDGSCLKREFSLLVFRIFFNIEAFSHLVRLDFVSYEALIFILLISSIFRTFYCFITRKSSRKVEKHFDVVEILVNFRFASIPIAFHFRHDPTMSPKKRKKNSTDLKADSKPHSNDICMQSRTKWSIRIASCASFDDNSSFRNIQNTQTLFIIQSHAKYLFFGIILCSIRLSTVAFGCFIGIICQLLHFIVHQQYSDGAAWRGGWLPFKIYSNCCISTAQSFWHSTHKHTSTPTHILLVALMAMYLISTSLQPSAISP